MAGQGVNYGRGVWHHPLIALDQSTDFLVVDRHAKDENCDEVSLEQADLWVGES
jgi:ureidoglycolate lyase